MERTNNNVGKVLAGASAAVVVAELTPINEIMRVAAFGGTMVASGNDALVSAGAASASAAIIEGGAAVAAAYLLETPLGKTAIEKINTSIEQRSIKRNLETNPVIDAGIAMLGGTAIATVIKHRQDTTRTIAQNIRFGLQSTAIVTALTGVEAYAVGVGIEHPSPLTFGLGIIAIGGIVKAYSVAKNKLTENKIQTAKYKLGVSPQMLGIEELDPASEYKHFQPISGLYWFNKNYFEKTYGTDQVYYFTHNNESEKSSITTELKDITDKGGIVVYDTITTEKKLYGDITDSPESIDGYELLPVRAGLERESKHLNQYVGEFIINKHKNLPYKTSTDLYEQYVEATSDGRIQTDPNNGASFERSIDGDEADRLWQIYDRPFVKLSDGHPISAGFDEETFKKILKDPSVYKVVNRVDGRLTTLALLLTDLDQCSWLDKGYYKKNHKDAYDTKNIFIFTGIVTDEKTRGASYSLRVIDLLAKVAALRDTPNVITFECSDISAKYIPKAVEYGIWKSGAAKIKGIRKPISQLNYMVVRKKDEQATAS